MNFKKIYGTNNCSLLNKEISAFRYFNGHQTGGRIINVKNKIYFTIGDYNDWEKVQNLDKNNGKIIEIDLDNKDIKIISMGHRNPQGLYYLTEYNKLISTEHGPKGGDEINLIDLNKSSISNYGWPISSYGSHYDVVPLNKYTNKVAPLKKSHSQFGFIEPLKYFQDSIGISEIIVNDILKNLEKFEENNDFLQASISVASLSKRFKTNSKYLSKVINVHKDKSFSNYINELRINYVIEELKVLKMLNHPNVIWLNEVIDDPKKDKLYVVTEWLTKGSLGDLVEKRNEGKPNRVGLPITKVREYL